MRTRDHKIIIFSPSLVAGGLERVISVLSKPLADHYEHVKLITWHDLPFFYRIDERVRIVCVEKECGTRNILTKMRWFRRYVILENPSVLISFSAPFNMIAIFSLFMTGVKVLVSERVDPKAFRWGKFKFLIRDILYWLADGILVQTDTSRRNYRKSLQKKAEIIPNPIVMPKTIVGGALHNVYKPIVVTATRLVKQKRLDDLINAFEIFHNTHQDYKLIIFGEGSERDTLEKLIRDKRMTDIVSMPGAIQKLWDELKFARMFVLPSAFEGMSNSLIEAMCLGLPCISTRVSGSIDYIQDGENGLLVEVGNVEKLAMAITKIADNDWLARKLGENASMVYNELNVDVVSRLWIDAISRYV